MTYAELAALQAKRSKTFSMAQTDAMAAYCQAEHDLKELESENAKLRELVRDLWLTGSLCDAIPDMRLQAKGGDWRTMKERVDEVLGIEVDA